MKVIKIGMKNISGRKGHQCVDSSHGPSRADCRVPLYHPYLQPKTGAAGTSWEHHCLPSLPLSERDLNTTLNGRRTPLPSGARRLGWEGRISRLLVWIQKSRVGKPRPKEECAAPGKDRPTESPLLPFPRRLLISTIPPTFERTFVFGGQSGVSLIWMQLCKLWLPCLLFRLFMGLATPRVSLSCCISELCLCVLG